MLYLQIMNSCDSVSLTISHSSKVCFTIRFCFHNYDKLGDGLWADAVGHDHLGDHLHPDKHPQLYLLPQQCLQVQNIQQQEIIPNFPGCLGCSEQWAIQTEPVSTRATIKGQFRHIWHGLGELEQTYSISLIKFWKKIKFTLVQCFDWWM